MRWSYALLFCALTTYAVAQTMPLIGVETPVSAVSYAGPGDVVSGAYGWWGLRAYNAAVAGTHAAALNLCNSSDTNCNDIHLTSSGGLNASDLAINSCGSTSTCLVHILYDQTGNGGTITFGGSTPIDQYPNFIANCIGTLPCMRENSTGNAPVMTSTVTAHAPPITYSVVMSAHVPNPGFNVRAFIQGDPFGILYNGNHFDFDMGTLVGNSFTITADVNYAVIGGTTGGTTGAFIGVSGNNVFSLNAGNSTNGTSIGGILSQATNNYSEFGIWPSSFSSTQLNNMDSNMQTYWGI